MLRKLRVAALIAAFTSAACVSAYAGGYFPDWPLVGGSSYCSAIVGASPVQAGPTGQGAGSVGSNGVICAQTVPPGPATLTGSEVIPADAGPPGVVSGVPQNSFYVQLNQVGGATNVVVPLTGFNVTIPAATSIELLVPAGTLATGTVVMPASPVDGQIVRIASSQTITALTVSPNAGQAMQLAIPTALTVNATGSQGYAWVFKAAAQGGAAANSWYRIQ